MKREELEARFLEILAEGREPMDVPEVRDAVASRPELDKDLRDLRRFVDRFEDMQWPELDARANIDHMTRAFEEGLRQGRRLASERSAARPWLGFLLRLSPAMAVVLVAVVAAFAWQRVAHDAKLAQLRDDVTGLRQMVAVSLLENESASQRLRGVQWSQHVDEPEERLLDALSQTLRNDRSVNVRLAAADAVGRFSRIPEVRNVVYETVASERDPLVQIQLIDVMVIVGDRQARDVLERLVERPDLADLVKTRASEALDEMRNHEESF